VLSTMGYGVISSGTVYGVFRRFCGVLGSV
jgi:hypothetical protein